MVDHHGQSRRESSPPPLPNHGERGQSFALAIAVVGIIAAVMLLSLLLPLQNLAPTDAHEGEASGNNRQTAGVGEDTSGAPVVAAGSNPGSPSSGSPVGTKHVDQLSSGSAGTSEKDELGSSGDGGQNVESVAVEVPHTPTRSTDDSPSNTFLTLQAQPNAGAPTRAENGAGENTKAEFFGVEAKGRKFVYIVDVSSSMIGEKFEMARHELLESINRLGNGQSFYIAFFNDIAHFQPTKGYVPARSRRKKRETSDWIMRAFPSGGTSPLEAVTFAIQLRPDAIYVLSDGEFDASIVSQIDAIDSEFRVPINTISFGIDASTLKKLAADNGGTYRLVH